MTDRLAERAALKARLRECIDPLGCATLVIDGGPGCVQTRTYRRPSVFQIEHDAEQYLATADAPVQVYLQGAAP